MKRIDRYNIEEAENWKGWMDKIPWISFPRTWEIKIIPPFAGAMARFLVKKGDKEVSVYLDVSQALGYWDGPYWELYPYKDDTFRTAMANVSGLLKAIKEALK